jgi:hypothetical protein
VASPGSGHATDCCASVRVRRPAGRSGGPQGQRSAFGVESPGVCQYCIQGRSFVFLLNQALHYVMVALPFGDGERPVRSSAVPPGSARSTCGLAAGSPRGRAERATCAHSDGEADRPIACDPVPQSRRDSEIVPFAGHTARRQRALARTGHTVVGVGSVPAVPGVSCALPIQPALARHAWRLARQYPLQFQSAEFRAGHATGHRRRLLGALLASIADLDHRVRRERAVPLRHGEHRVKVDRLQPRSRGGRERRQARQHLRQGVDIDRRPAARTQQ